MPSLRLKELWSYRELVGFLVWRDVKVRYKQTLLGVVWAILQPLVTAAVFTLIFNRVASVPSDGVPYPLFSYVGLLMWTFFSQGVATGAESLVGSANLITKTYFPRLAVPLSVVLAGLVNLLVALPVLGLMMVHYRVTPGLEIAAVIPIVALATATTLAVAVWLSALNVQYRDVRHTVPFLLQIGLFMTPVIYPASFVLPRLERLGLPAWCLGLNPMAGVVEAFRWAVFGDLRCPVELILTSVIVTTGMLIIGAFYFRSVERTFADVV